MRGLGFALRQLHALRVLVLGYAPQRFTPSAWDRLFQSGAYDRLDGAIERARYSLIVGHQDLIGARSILDVGCGQGVLARRLARTPYERYLGIDISQAAIDMARAGASDPRNRYLVSDMDRFDGEERFDWVIFNECLYYLDDPLGTVRHFWHWLTPGGHLSISMYDCPGARAIWKGLRSMPTVETVDLEHKGAARWTVKLLRPGPTAPG